MHCNPGPLPQLPSSFPYPAEPPGKDGRLPTESRQVHTHPPSLQAVQDHSGQDLRLGPRGWAASDSVGRVPEEAGPRRTSTGTLGWPLCPSLSFSFPHCQDEHCRRSSAKALPILLRGVKARKQETRPDYF